MRIDPFGAVVEQDRGPATTPQRRVSLEAARGGYVSCQLTAALTGPGEYRLELGVFPRESGIQADLYREWLHYVPASKSYYPDALVPVRSPYRSAMPEPDNRIAKQTAQTFWLDLWIPETARPGTYETAATLHAGGTSTRVPIVVKVLAAKVPREDAVTIDHNTYGTSWFTEQYPELTRAAGPDFFNSDKFYSLIHAYHRIFYEHRGAFHQLGYGHAGKVGPEFAPRACGQREDQTHRGLDGVRPALWSAARRIGVRLDTAWTESDSVCLSAGESRVAGIVFVVGRAGLRARVRERGIRDGAPLP